MPINGVPSSLPDKKYIAALEKTISDLVRDVARLKGQVDELRRSR